MGEAHAFLSELCRGAPGHALAVLWTKDNKKSSYYPATPEGVSAAAAFAESHRKDVYVHVSLAAEERPANKRLLNLSSAGILGLWADIDVNGGPDNKTGAAPDVETAARALGDLVEPTLLVSSGYGLHAWWLLEDGPWIFTSPEERERAAELAGRWTRLVRAACQAHGFTTDATQDLARILRVPGTVNAKGIASGWQPRDVTGWPDPVSEQDGPRHDLQALLELAATAPAGPARSPTGNGHPPGPGDLILDREAQPPLDKLEALRENSQTFDSTWRHTRREQAAQSWSLSEYDLALCSLAVQAEWTDQELANLLIAHRRRHGDLEKALRTDYVQRTVGKARIEHRKTERERDRLDALDELQAVAETGEGDPDLVLSAFNRIVGGPVIKELVQDGRDPEAATFTLVMSNGDPVRLGGAGNLVNQDRFRERFMVVTARLLPKVKTDEWTDAVNALMTTRQLRESHDDTPEGTVVEWLRRYLYERVAPKAEVDEQVRAREPFVKDGEVFVFGQSFASWVRGAMRLRATDSGVKDMLRHAGFERRQVAYLKVDEDASTRSTASYYAAKWRSGDLA